MLSNIYLIGKVANGAGVELISFREPMEDNDDIHQILIHTIDTEQKPITTRGLIVRELIVPKTKSLPLGSYDMEQLEVEFSNFIVAEKDKMFEYLENPRDYMRAITLNLQ